MKHLHIATWMGVGLMLLGCQTVPQGQTGGRIDPYRSTEADRASSKASIPALLEFCDVTAQRLAQDLSQIDELQGTDPKVTLELGDLYNKTRTPSNDFELIQRRLRGRLFASPQIRKHFNFVARRARMNRLSETIAADGQTGNTVRSDPATTYVLMGDFLEANRGGRRQYYFEFTLTNLAKRTIVFQNSYDLGQMK